MKPRWTLMFAVALIGACLAITAFGSDAQTGVEPSAPVQLAFLQVPAPQLSSPALPWGASALAAQDAQKSHPMCRQDSDCKLVDYYCDGCNCLALPAKAKPPKCNGTIVQCLVAPCANKHAACRDGQCVVADGAAAAN